MTGGSNKAKTWSSSFLQTCQNQTSAITETPLPLLEEWATETEKQLNAAMHVNKRNAWQHANRNRKATSNLLADLKNAEDIRKKEAAIIGEKAQLQAKYGSRFNELETNWQDIVTVLEWTQKVQAAFLDIPVPQAFADIAAKGPTAAPSNTELNQKCEASLKVL